MAAARTLLVFLVAVCAGCAGLPSGIERSPSAALSDTGDTRLGRALAAAAAARPGETGVHALGDARDAFAARVLLARAAERSLDVQYYILRNDTTGNLLCAALWEAAERGVRVRLLLDDNNTRGLDDVLAKLDSHPNIEVRLFNPYANRRLRLGELVFDFARLNRRMHNKSYIADNRVAIVGGRNIGDEYFGADTPVAFADLDVLTVGAVVGEISASFDAYWNSESAYPAASLLRPVTPDRLAQVRAAWTRSDEDPRTTSYLDSVRGTPLIGLLLRGDLPLEWTRARVVADDPAKVLHPPDREETHMLPRLIDALGKPQRELDLVSPYFVPSRDGTAALVALAQRGVRVRVLTNSLAATDVAPVHAGYAKYREALLRGGVQLFELKPRAGAEPDDDGGSSGSRRRGSSDASLHAKTFAVDRRRIFVGSFNLDPRSARLNTELGVVFDSARLAGQLSGVLDSGLPGLAYALALAPDGKLVWVDGDARFTTEPDSGALRRLWVDVLSLLPIEWLL